MSSRERESDHKLNDRFRFADPLLVVHRDWASYGLERDTPDDLDLPQIDIGDNLTEVGALEETQEPYKLLVNTRRPREIPFSMIGRKDRARITGEGPGTAREEDDLSFVEYINGHAA
ncbi:MAG: hypothetical protein HYS32_03945 [Candidatus Woesearchaeota archaeon]|nr:MAG: hypothetical protein HYS32_03945 [Candidatus Woesearchaeota archaeon]